MSEIIGDEIAPPRVTRGCRRGSRRPIEPFNVTYEMVQVDLVNGNGTHEISAGMPVEPEAQEYWGQIKACMKTYDMSTTEAKKHLGHLNACMSAYDMSQEQASWMLTNWDSIDYLSAEYSLDVNQAVGFIKKLNSLIGDGVDVAVLKEIAVHGHEKLGDERLGTAVEDFLEEFEYNSGMTTSDGVPILCSANLTERDRKNRALLMEGNYVEGRRDQEDSLYDYGLKKVEGAGPDQLDRLVQSVHVSATRIN
jgi:hypothetical protein